MLKQTSQVPPILELAKLLQPWDRRVLHRNHMKPAWKEVVEKIGDRATVCMICGRDRVIKGHVLPQSDGFLPWKNLVPLCERRQISPYITKALEKWWSAEPGTKNLDDWKLWNQLTFGQLLGGDEHDIGCHKLYDEGLISVHKMSNCEPTRSNPDLRHSALEVPMCKLDSTFSAGTSRHVRLKHLKKYASSFTEGSNEWCEAHCEYISTSRRLASKVVMNRALRVISKVNSHITNRSISPKVRSRFYYEEALTWMQRHPDPDKQKAIECLEKSIEAAEDEAKSSAMSTLELIRAEMIRSVSVTNAQRLKWEKRQREVLSVIEKEPNKRWDVNHRLHRVKIRIKAHYKPDVVLEEIESIRQARCHLTLVNGWTQFQGIHLLSLRGMVHAQLDHYEDALFDITSAIMTMKHGCIGKRVEGYKDIALCAAWALTHMKGQSHRAKKVAVIANKMVDGRSGIWLAP